ncbi:putative C-type lectin 4 protein [Naja naja]|uniref:C-type lectin domain-containing protein n=1 Tax=Naja naja TaxID=35670 RepID=A0A8C6YLY6_NAJNA|nr:putative C-type lectin 4 protein [Naja naja]
MGYAIYISFCCLGILITSCLLGAEPPKVHLAKAASCPRDWLQKQGNCYGYFDKKLSWSKAEIECQNYGPGCHLASILSYQESMLVAEHIKDKQSSLSHVWIGLHDVSGKRRWRWADESVFNYKAWKEGEPNNIYQNEHCVELTTGFKQWNDLFCSRLNAYICKHQL